MSRANDVTARAIGARPGAATKAKDALMCRKKESARVEC
jgi:hypothetical protein